MHIFCCYTIAYVQEKGKIEYFLINIQDLIFFAIKYAEMHCLIHLLKGKKT